MRLRYLIYKELLQMKRNPFLKVLVLIYPVFIMCVMPWVMNMEVKNIAIVVVDNDRSTLSSNSLKQMSLSSFLTILNETECKANSLKFSWP